MLFRSLSTCVLRFASGERREGVFLLWTGTLAAALGGLWYVPNHAQAVAPVLANVGRSLHGPGIAGGIIVIAAFVLVIHIRGRRTKVKSDDARIAFIALVGCVVVAMLAGGMAARQWLGAAPDTASGSFLSLLLYCQLSLPLLLLGAIGFGLSLRGGEHGSPWQWALVWCAALVFSQFFFYLRFLLLFDFFLLPFAAVGAQRLWSHRDSTVRWLAAALVCVQCAFSVQRMSEIKPPLFSAGELRSIAAFSDLVRPGDKLIVADNVTAPWVLGMLPSVVVAGPGVFASPPYDRWERFIYGDDRERAAFLQSFGSPAFVYLSFVFRGYYPDDVTRAVAGTPCLIPTPAAGLYRVVCPAP